LLIDHYYNVVNGEKYAKYLVCKNIELISKGEKKSEDYIKTHNKISSNFINYYTEISKQKEIKQFSDNYLFLKKIIVSDIIKSCELCEHKCRVNRFDDKKGRCGVGVIPRISSYFLHMGEERPIIPSGTIFFNGCTLSCAFNTHKIYVCA
jgi:putative pyruvate formate lyase activating enzyme